MKTRNQVTAREFEELVDVFKDAWELADKRGRTGSRTNSGLLAVFNRMGIEVTAR